MTQHLMRLISQGRLVSRIVAVFYGAKERKGSNTSTAHQKNRLLVSTTHREPQSCVNMADPKQQIMDQVRQQAALSNARALVEVRAWN